MAGQGVDLSGGGGAPPGAAGGFGANMGAQAAQAAMNDPTVQAHMQQAAYTNAHNAFHGAKEGMGQAATEFAKYINQGPAGISVLCFLGGFFTAVIGALGLLNIGELLNEPFKYILAIYLTGFGVVSFLLEADCDRLANLKLLSRLAPRVHRYQLGVYERAKFLTETGGRGLFYFFIGTLAITQCMKCLTFVVGLWNLLMGSLCLCMSCGINPFARAPPTGGPAQGTATPLVT